MAGTGEVKRPPPGKICVTCKIQPAVALYSKYEASGGYHCADVCADCLAVLRQADLRELEAHAHSI